MKNLLKVPALVICVSIILVASTCEYQAPDNTDLEKRLEALEAKLMAQDTIPPAMYGNEVTELDSSFWIVVYSANRSDYMWKELMAVPVQVMLE